MVQWRLNLRSASEAYGDTLAKIDLAILLSILVGLALRT